MNEIIKILEENIRQVHEGAESIYELGYEDALKYVLNLLKEQANVDVSNNRG